jgi:hypothetical protein
MRCKKPNAGAVEPEYQRTDKEKAAVKKHCDRVAAEPTTPRLKVTASDIWPDHPDPALGSSLLAEALGTANCDFLKGLLRQLANAGSQGRGIDDEGVNFLLAVVTGFKPRDQLEAMLTAQMGVIHTAIMTFTMQVEALSDRRGTEGYGAARFGGRRRAGDRRQCYPSRAPARAGGKRSFIACPRAPIFHDGHRRTGACTDPITAHSKK